jgi:hypothetical protein
MERIGQSLRLRSLGVLMALVVVASGRGGSLRTGMIAAQALILDQTFTSPSNLGADIKGSGADGFFECF